MGTFARGNKTRTQRTLTEDAGHRSDRVWSRWLTLTEQAGHRSVRACSRWPCLFQATRQGFCRLALHLDDRLAVSRRKKSLAINLVVRPAIWGANLYRPSRAQIGSHLFQATRLGLCRLAINLVARPAIWGESGVSMMNPTPDPPYKIIRNFKFQSCGPNLSCGGFRLD